MRSNPYPLRRVLDEKQQWVVPVYQRHYEWETAEDQQIPKLWEDLRDRTIERLENREPHPHYFGAILTSEPDNQPFGTVRQRLLVDGQQRITTFHLTLIAIREAARDHQSLKLLDTINAYIINETSDGMVDPDRERFKLWPSTFDRALFQDIVQCESDTLRAKHDYKHCFYKNGKLIGGRSPKMLRAYWHLYETIGKFVTERHEDGDSTKDIFDALLHGFLEGLQIVLIELDSNDDAQAIFASLNGLGKPLAPFDLIRNDVFHRAGKTHDDSQRLFDEYWQSFEDPFWSAEVRQGRRKRTRADHLIAHAVIAETARDINVSKIATEYQRYARARAFPTVADELQILVNHARTYRAMEECDKSVAFARITKVLRIWDTTAFHPLILWINAQALDDAEKTRLFNLLESYIVRREICGLTPKNHNKVVTSIIKSARGTGAIVDAVLQHVAASTGDASRMPSDEEMADSFASRSVYPAISSSRLRYILENLEYAKRMKFDEVTVSTTNLTIEHVLPRSWAENWPLANGVTAPCESTWQLRWRDDEVSHETQDLMQKREEVVDTFGNLTVLTQCLNSSIRNAAWDVKRQRLGESLLALNRDLAAQPVWNEDRIAQRAADLAATAQALWPMEPTCRP